MMIRKIIIGKTASGKTLNFVKPAIRNYNGNVVLINSKDDIAYLELEDCVTSKTVKELNTLSDFTKIQINLNNQFKPLNEKETSSLYEVIKRYINNRNMLFIFEEVGNTVPELVPYLLKEQKNIGADIMIVVQSLNQLKDCYKYSNFEKVLSKWNIISAEEEMKEVQ